MPMTLYFKRAKSFVQQSDNANGTRKFLANPGPTPIPVPSWVAKTLTFQRGILDQSIVNLTATDQMIKISQKFEIDMSLLVYQTPKKVVAKVVEPDEVDDLDDEDDGPADYQGPAVPKFGAQPMTPTQKAPNVGGITASTGRKK